MNSDYWEFAFRFEDENDAKHFIKWVRKNRGFESTDVVFHPINNSVIILSPLIDAFPGLAKRACMRYIIHTVTCERIK